MTSLAPRGASSLGRTRCVALIAAVLGVAGCGTTVSGTSLQEQSGATGMNGPQAQPTSATAVGGGASGSAPTLGEAGAVSGSNTASGGSAAGPVGGGARSSQSGPGQQTGPVAAVAKGPIKVGFLVSDYTKTAAAFEGGAAPDPQQWNKYLIKYYNAHGGLGGRRIAPVFYTIDGGSNDYNAADQAACASFTQDNHVELVLSNLWVSQTLTSCLLRAGVPQFEGTVETLNDEYMLAHTPNLFIPSGMALDREATALISESVRLGVLTTKDKLGLLYDTCTYSVRAAQEAAIPTARRYGISMDADEYSQCGSGFSDVTKFTQDVSSAEFKMRQDGVTHMMFLTQGEGGAMTFFGKAADSQHWNPTYLVSSNVLMTSNETEGPAAMPQDQAQHVHGIGWDPTLDSDEALRTPTPQQTACLQHTRVGGGSAPTTVNDTLTMYGACNAISFAAAALHASGGAGGLAALRPAIESMGTSFVSVTTAHGTTRFGPNRHDGAVLVAPFAWQSKCSCFVYVGPPHQIP